MSDENRITLNSYSEKFLEYGENSSQELLGASKDWIDRVLTCFPKNSKFFEIGTAHARDASYIRGKGYNILCSDAVDEFVADIKQKGFDVVKFNVLIDEFQCFYDMIIANAVMPHFKDSELDIAFEKSINALNPGGAFAFTIKSGQGDEWHNDKIGAPRYFKYHTGAEILEKLKRFELREIDIQECDTGRSHSAWIYVIAFK